MHNIQKLISKAKVFEMEMTDKVCKVKQRIEKERWRGNTKRVEMLERWVASMWSMLRVYKEIKIEPLNEEIKKILAFMSGRVATYTPIRGQEQFWDPSPSY